MNSVDTIAPTILTIFGITGDLCQRKLFPALLDLYCKGMLPADFRVAGVGRRAWSDADLQQFVREALLEKNHSYPMAVVEVFIGLFTYCQGDFTTDDTYQVIKNKLAQVDIDFKVCSNKLFYLAVPPDYYEAILRKLGQHEINLACGGGAGWSRILIEKPFGRDLVTAQKLDLLLGELFTENQIFRIDHYLGKEAVRNILAFRFADQHRDAEWNNQFIDHVYIRLHESLGVETRGNFYNSVGALRDVGQNHMLQLLAIVAMDNPGTDKVDDIHQSREAVMTSLVPFDNQTIVTNTIRGQYDHYNKENQVPAGSMTETYFLLKTFIDNDRWRGVPFYLESGKKMQESIADINVYFKNQQPPVHFLIQPTGSDNPATLDAYEKILYDCIVGDQTLFVTTNEVVLAWKFIMSILNNWEVVPLISYASGSLGPIEKEKVMPSEIII